MIKPTGTKTYGNDPIFIVGVHRSGTTLLRYMLSSSPRLFVSPESDFIPRFFLRDPRTTLSDERIAEMLDTIFSRYRFARDWEGYPPGVEAVVAEMPDRSPAAFLDTLYGTYARQQDAVRWGDKTPIYTSYMDLIHEIFPRARFVHIIRDGRDVSLSMLDKWGKSELHIDAFFAARNWVRRIRQAQKSGAQLGSELYYELRYESLVEHPETELGALCDFLQEPYVPEMARPHILGQQRIEPGSFSDPIRKPPNTTRVGRWRQEMSEKEQRLFQAVAGRLMKELGYGTEPLGPMPLSEMLHLAFLGIKYAVLQAGRRTAQWIGLMPPI